MSTARRPRLTVERVVLTLSLCAGLAALGYFLVFATSTGGDFGIYYESVLAHAAGDPTIYGGGQFAYPPIMLLVFSPMTLVSQFQAYVMFLLVTVVAAGVLASWSVATIEAAGHDVSRLDWVLLLLTFVVSTQAITTLALGQINLWLVLLLALGVRALETGNVWLAGVALAMAAIPKLFLGFMGVYLLAQRVWRAVLAAVGAGLGSFVAGALYSPARTVEYFEFIRGESGWGIFSATRPISADTFYVSFARPLKWLVPSMGATAYLVVGTVIATLCVGLLYRDTSTKRQRLAAFLGTIVVAIMLVLRQHAYGVLVYYPAVPLLYLADPGWQQRLLGAGFLVVNLQFVPAQLALVLGVTPLAPGLQAAMLAVARAVLTAVSVPGAGLLLMLAGCCLIVAADTTPESDTLHRIYHRLHSRH